MTTVREKLDELTKPEPDDRAERIRILQMLPGEIQAPTVSNTQGKEHDPRAWLSFHRPSYDPQNTFDPIAILRTLEANGWQTVPATLVKRDDWRPGPEIGTQDELPEERNNYKLTDSWPICPLWVVPEQHTGIEARCFMRGPDGNVYKVIIGTNLPCHIEARQIKFRGGWRYERGTAKIVHPDKWCSIERDSEPIATKHVQSRAFVDTDQGISGNIYWEPIAHDHTEFPMSAADMLEALTK